MLRNPCPSCQGRNIHIAEWFDDDSGESTYYGECLDCGYRAETQSESYEAAVDHWNCRTSFDLHDADEGLDDWD